MEKVQDELLLLLRARYPYVWLQTWEEERATRLLTTCAEQLQRRVLHWNLVDGLRPAPSGVDTAQPAAAIEALLPLEQPFVLVWRDPGHVIDAPAIVRRLRDLRTILERRQQCVVFVAPAVHIPHDLEKDVVLAELPLPGLKEVARLFHAVVRENGLDIELPLFERYVKASLGLTEDEIRRVYQKVLLRAGRFSEEELALVIAEKSQIIRKTEFLEFHATTEGVSGLGGLDNLKAWITSRDLAFTEKARKYGLPQPKGLFLLGVQGCGKSLTAKVVADLWRVPLLRLDVGSLVGGSGPADEGLRTATSVAESMAPVVLWVDEIEKAFAGVEGGRDAASSARVFGNFVTWLQEKTAPVFVLATANDVRNLPPELLRKGRFDDIFFVDLPNIHERQAIVEIHLRKRGRDPRRFATWEIAEATEKWSGAELEQAVIDAMFYAFARDREVESQDVLRVVRETVPLAVTMDQRIKELREWARTRTRPATFDTRRVDYFDDWDGGGDDSPGPESGA
jgi:hypothetical protein